MKSPHSIARLIAGMALVGIATVWTSAAQPVVTVAEPPAGTGKLQVEWIKVMAPGYGPMLAAVARPTGAGPFPTVIVLHGSHGFALEYVRLAQSLAQRGLLGVAVCWFSGRVGAGTDSITTIDWPGLPPRPDPSSGAALQAIDTLVEAVGAMRGAHPDRIGLFGHSRGGGIALNYVMSPRKVRATVLHSTGYPGEWSDRASGVSTPVLILHGTSDSPADGGSAFTAVQKARDFEAVLRRLEKSVEAQYYEGGGHNTIFTSSTQFDKEVDRAATFFLRHLGGKTDRSTTKSGK